MSLESLRARPPETFKDARLNLSALANEEVRAARTK